MHFCTAHIAIGGDDRNIMFRDYFAPLSWPEIDVLREIHGDEAIREITPFARVNQTARDERNRLAMKYGDEVLATRWGGKNPPTELDAAGVRLKPDIVWKNPLSGRTEKTTAGGSLPYTIPPEERPVAEVVGDYAVREAAVEAEAGPKDEMYHDDPEDLVDPTLPEPVAEEAPKARKK